MELSTLLPFTDYLISISQTHIQTIEGVFSEIEIDKSKLQRLLNSLENKPLWADYSEIASLPKDHSLQLDLLGVSKEPVLLLQLPKNNSAYLFKFKLYSTNENLFYGRDQKNLIENIAIFWLSARLIPQNTPDKNPSAYYEVAKNQIVEVDRLNNKLLEMGKNIHSLYERLFRHFLMDDLGAEDEIIITESSIEYLNSLEIDLIDLKPIIKEALKISKSLYPSSKIVVFKNYFFVNQNIEEKTDFSTPFGINKDVIKTTPPMAINPVKIIIPQKEESVLPQERKDKTSQTTAISTSDQKLLKTMNLLDKYENAVNKLIEQRIPIMGKNISSVCVPQISAPALTDSINKHKERIMICLKNYPENWPLLKKNYSPITKLMINA